MKKYFSILCLNFLLLISCDDIDKKNYMETNGGENQIEELKQKNINIKAEFPPMFQSEIYEKEQAIFKEITNWMTGYLNSQRIAASLAGNDTLFHYLADLFIKELESIKFSTQLGSVKNNNINIPYERIPVTLVAVAQNKRLKMLVLETASFPFINNQMQIENFGLKNQVIKFIDTSSKEKDAIKCPTRINIDNSQNIYFEEHPKSDDTIDSQMSNYVEIFLKDLAECDYKPIPEKEKNRIPKKPASTRFIINGDGTVTDNKSKLMWKQCSEGLSGVVCESGIANGYTLYQAFTQARNVNKENFSGYKNWRVPNEDELWSLRDTYFNDHAIDESIFPNTPLNAPFWGVGAFVLDFGTGYGDHIDKNHREYVRLVRNINRDQDQAMITRLDRRLDSINKNYPNNSVQDEDDKESIRLIKNQFSQENKLSINDDFDIFNDPTSIHNSQVDKEQQYQKSYNMLVHKKITEAISGFKSIISDDPTSLYATNAQFWLGKAYLLNNDIKSAKNEFNKILEKYSSSQKMPYALLELGIIEKNENNNYAAKKYFNRLVFDFPNSVPTQTAKNELKNIDISEQNKAQNLQLEQELLTKWNDAHSSAHIHIISDLYNSTVKFYGQTKSNQEVINAKLIFFKKYPNFKQEVSLNNVLNNGDVLKITFNKDVTLNNNLTRFSSYLEFQNIAGTWKIITESDTNTDDNLSKNQSQIEGAIEEKDECYNLWYQRNLIYAENGYCFTSNLGKEVFKSFHCVTKSHNLSSKDKNKVDDIIIQEKKLGCDINTDTTQYMPNKPNPTPNPYKNNPQNHPHSV